jgi:hypothetical protein
MGYEVLVDEYTAHRDVRELRDAEGNVTGSQLGLGKIYFKGEVIPDNALGQVYKDALDNEEDESHEWLSQRLKQVSGDASEDPKKRLGLPFADYEQMDEDDVVAAMRHLPSGLIQRIKQYEEEFGDNRQKIVSYIIGFGSDPDARQEGRVGSKVEEDENRVEAAEDKATAKLTTREVPEEGNVTHGEGYTGTGEGAKPYGQEKADDEDDGDKPKTNVRSRRGRRDRQASKTQEDDTSSGEES